MAASAGPRYHRNDYTVAYICPMGVELAPVEAMLDEIHNPLPTNRDQNAYTLGRMGGHNIVVAIMPETGGNVAATVATQLLNDFPSIRFGLLVGIGGGVPGDVDVRLGDIVVSQPTRTFGGVVQYDLGKKVEDGTRFERTGLLNKPPAVLSAAARKLESQYRRRGHNLLNKMSDMLQKNPAMITEYSYPSKRDQLFITSYKHQSGPNCDRCDRLQTISRPDRTNNAPRVHFGTIGSANLVVKDSVLRDELQRDMQILCIEMEAAGIMNDFPCLVIRGICDYADSHKNNEWQGYAACVAAAYAKDLLLQIAPAEVQAEKPVTIIESTNSQHQQISNIPDAVSFLRSPMTLITFVVLLVVLSFWRGIQNTNNGQQVNTGVMYGKQTFNLGPRPELDFRFIKPIGLHLDQAPYIDATLFIGRASELEHMYRLLSPAEGTTGSQRLVLGGLGGVGKTQLAIAYARQNSATYNTILWLDATSENTLKASFRSIAGMIVDVRDLEELSNEEIVVGVKRWLLDKENTKWLLIFDNYDNPKSFNLRSYYPWTSHGAIIVTTRMPNHVDGYVFEAKALPNVDDSLQILQSRSQRANISNDNDARRLAIRLGGLPLALTTAGIYLRHSVWTFEQYLHEYEKRWETSSKQTLQIADYHDRTLYTAWDLSYTYLQQEHPSAALMLKLLAYFGSHPLWYELFHAGRNEELPSWLREISEHPNDFDNVLRTLTDHSFVQFSSDSHTYGVHTCVHDWILFRLNMQTESWMFWYAWDCMANMIREQDWISFGSSHLSPLVAHATRLTHSKFNSLMSELDYPRIRTANPLAQLLKEHAEFNASKAILQDLLIVQEKMYGAESEAALKTAYNLGVLYIKTDKLLDAESMLLHSLAGGDKEQLPEEKSTLERLSTLGSLYERQGRFREAEVTLERALAGQVKTLGHDHESTMNTAHSLGVLYTAMGETTQAENLLTSTLANKERVFGTDHLSTLITVASLGALYDELGKSEDAELMNLRALAGMRKVLGEDHQLVLGLFNNLGLSCVNSGRLVDADALLSKALSGLQEKLGHEHTSTLDTVNNVGKLRLVQGNRAEARKMFLRALRGNEKVLGLEHERTLRAAHNLGLLYTKTGQLKEAEIMFHRVFNGLAKSRGRDHRTTTIAAENFISVYLARGKDVHALGDDVFWNSILAHRPVP